MQLLALALFDSSFDSGASMESILQWENAMRGMESVLPLLRDAAMVVVFCWVAVLLPMSIFRTMHPLIARSLRLSSLLVGGVCWWQAVIVTYRLMGSIAVVTGMMFAGLGVIPLALLETAAKQDWFVFGDLLATAALTILARVIARGISQRNARKKAGARDLRNYAHE